MNKFIKIMLVTSSMIAIIGIIFIGIGALTGSKMGLRVRGSGIEIIEAEKIKDANPLLDEFNSVEIDLSYADVVIEKGSDYGIEMIYFDSNYVPEYTVDQGTLVVTDNSKSEGFYNYLNIDMSFGLEKNKVVIYIPEGASVDSYNISVDSGSTNITVSGESDEYSVDARTKIGTVTVNDILKGLKFKDIVGGAEKTIEIKNDLGFVNITFE